LSITLTRIQSLVRYNARNATDSGSYSDTQVDEAIQGAADEWIRESRATQTTAAIACTQGSADIPTTPAGFVAERNLGSYFTYSGNLIEPRLIATDIETVLRAQLDGQNSGDGISPPTAPPLGQPTMFGFSTNGGAGKFDKRCQYAFTLNLVWYQPFTTWTPGSGSPTLTFNLGDEHLRQIARGAVWYLQSMEPDNAVRADKIHEEFLVAARRFRALGSGGRGQRVLMMDTPYGANGNFRRNGG
jgi:hypothetical protein